MVTLRLRLQLVGQRLSMSQEDLDKKLNALKTRYKAELPAKVAAIAKEWLMLNSRLQQSSEISTDAFFTQVHSLSGSAATYGFSELSKLCRNAETKVRSIAKNIAGINNGNQEIEQLIKKLSNDLPEILANPPTHYQQASTTSRPPGSATTPVPNYNSLTVFSFSSSLCQKTYSSLSHYGIDVTVFQHTEALCNAIHVHPPSVLLFDMDTLDEDDIKQAIHHLSTTKSIKLFCSKKDDFTHRMAAINYGSSYFYQVPINYSLLANLLDNLHNECEQKNYKLLMIDDDNDTLQSYQTLLEEQGIQFFALTTGENLLPTISAVQPDLILMDMHLPHYSGILLTQLLRQHETYSQIPIIFLSLDDGEQVRNLSRLSGCDDYICKSIAKEQFAKIIMTKLTLAKQNKERTIQDPLTHLLLFNKIKDQFVSHMTYSRRTLSPLSLAFIDLDHFKRINDQYSHMAGDFVLKVLAQQLGKALRKYDLICRYGGEEFVILMPNTQLAEASRKLNDLRQTFSRSVLQFQEANLTCTFSAGLTEYIPDETLEAFLQRADQCLYKAKKSGRNRIICE